jgi:hypothetical protein
MYNVTFEVGGIGSGQNVIKHLVFGWMFVDTDGSQYLVEALPVRMQEEILHRLPPHIKDDMWKEIQHAKHAKVDVPEQAPQDIVFEQKPPKVVDTDESVRAAAKRSMENLESTEEFTEFCERLVAAEHPLSTIKGWYAIGVHRGWCADIAPTIQDPWPQ